MNLTGQKRHATTRGRRTVKGKPLLMKLKKPLRLYLQREAKTSGKSMVRVVEELLEYRSTFKVWPPK